MKTWFRVKVQAEDETVADVNIFDFIGDWIDELWGFDGVTTAKSFVAALEGLPESVKVLRVHINSPGGDVFGATTIANALRDQRMTKGRKVETVIDGLAASAASVIAMAGEPVTMADNALLMIHNPWTHAVGDADDLAKTADQLSTVRDTIIATYQWQSELSAEEIAELMDAETWMDAAQASELGFVSNVVEGLQAAASIDPRGLAHLRVPEEYADRVSALVRSASTLALTQAPALAPAVEPEPEPEPEPVASAQSVIALCEEAGLDVAFAKDMLDAGLAPEDAAQLVSAEKERRAADAERRAEIAALFERRDMKEIGDVLADSGVSLEDAKQVAVEAAALADKAEIDSGLEPGDPTRNKSVINYREVYARQNNPAAS